MVRLRGFRTVSRWVACANSWAFRRGSGTRYAGACMAKGKSATRRGERELAFQVLYGLSFTPASDVDDLRRIFRISPDYLARWQGQEPPVHPSGFAWELVEGVWSKSDELDASISNFSRNWRVDRMGRVELTLLRLAVYEIMEQAALADSSVQRHIDGLTVRKVVVVPGKLVNIVAN
jgi:Transcription termination factor